MMRRLVIFVFICSMLTGCMRLENGNHIYNDTTTESLPAEKVFEADKRLVSTATIIHQKELVSGVTVKTFSRFHKERIEEELKGKLEEVYPEFEITVSADNKVVHQTAKIIKAQDKDQLEDKLKKIVSLLKEET